MNFTIKSTPEHQLVVFESNIPYTKSAGCLGMNLNVKFKWKEHVMKNCK